MNPFWLPFGAKRAKEEQGPRYGDVMERAIAACFDLTVIYVLFFQLFMLVKEWLYSYVNHAELERAAAEPTASAAMQYYSASGLPQLWLLFCLFQLVVIGVYMVSVQSIWQTTPGKWLMGLKVVKRHSFEQPENWRYIVRYLGYIPAALPLTLGIIWAGFNRERRGWHDMIAGTVVIHTRPRGWYFKQLKRLWKREEG